MALLEHFNWLLPIALATGVFSLVYLFVFFKRLKKLRLIAATGKLFGFFVYGLIALLASFLLLSVSSYQRLIYEQQVATLKIKPNGKQRFVAELTTQDGSKKVYPLYGDQVQVDAYIIKWKPWLTTLGMDTSYRLDRISGRFQMLNSDLPTKAMAFELSSSDQLDIALWRQQYAALKWMVDVEHGSASYVAADKAINYHLVISNDAVILRKIN